MSDTKRAVRSVNLAERGTSVIDLRLVLIAAVAWLASAVWAGGVWAPSTLTLHLICAIGAGVILIRWIPANMRTRPSARVTLMLILLVWVSFSLRAAMSAEEATNSELRRLSAEGAQVRCSLTLESYPTPTRFARTTATAHTNECSHLGKRIHDKRRIFVSGHALAGMSMGDTLEATGTLSESRRTSPHLAGQIRLHHIHRYHPAQGIQGFTSHLRVTTTEALVDHTRELRALLPALALGDKSGLTHDDHAALRAASLSHIVVISGFHTALIMSTLSRIIPGRGTFKLGVSALILGLITVATGAGSSILRAALMGMVASLSATRGQGYTPSSALSLAVIALLMWDPLQAVSPSFALSVAATAGIITSGLRHPHTHPPEGHLLATIRAALLTIARPTLYAQAFVLPISALTGLPVSAWGILANILVSPVIAPLCIGAVVTLLISPTSSGVSSWIASLCEPLCTWLFRVSRTCHNLPGSQMSITPWHVCILALILTAIYVGRKWGARKHGRNVTHLYSL